MSQQNKSIMNRRRFITLSGMAGGLLLAPSANAWSKIITPEAEVFSQLREKLRGHLLTCIEKSKIMFGKDLRLHSPSNSATYLGIWPDDFLYPMQVQPGMYRKEEYTAIAEFLTNSIVDLPCFPDRVETDGMPVMQPGSLSSPHARHMPLHLPAAWVRLLDHLEQSGAVIPRKNDWAKIFQRSIENVPFSCGLAYIDPQFPGVDFGFHDPEAITGFVLMSSMLLHFGLLRAVRLFDKHIAPAVIEKWKLKAETIQKNLYRLYDSKEGAYLAGSKDCRQVNVWGNGLAYWMSPPDVKKSIVAYYKSNRSKIFLKGFTRQIAAPGGWQRQLVNVPLGNYTNGGFWSVGSAWVLPAIADQDVGFATEIANEMVNNLVNNGIPEWIDAKGAGGASGFLAGIAAPMLGLTAIIEKRPLSDYF